MNNLIKVIPLINWNNFNNNYNNNHRRMFEIKLLNKMNPKK